MINWIQRFPAESDWDVKRSPRRNNLLILQNTDNYDAPVLCSEVQFNYTFWGVQFKLCELNYGNNLHITFK